MKISKKIISVILSSLMLFSVCGLFASAAEEGTFSMLNYNVAGLPDPQVLIGNSERYVIEKEGIVGQTLNASGVDVIAVQEDFNYHDYLVAEMTAYTYKTTHSGGIPVGDGLNIYSKFPIYNTDRVEWNQRSGIIEGGCDELTPKGFIYTTIEIADGVYVDFIDMHADAYDDEGSRAARKNNFEQVAEYIKNRTSDRPIIITGDYNEYMLDASDSAIRQILCEGCGLKDAFCEIWNYGNYLTAAYYLEQYPEMASLDKWGNWDTVERFLYKDGGGVHLTALSYEMINYKDEDGVILSDHSAAKIVFSYTVDEDSNTGSNEDMGGDQQNALVMFIKKIFNFLQALARVFSDWDNVKELLGI